MPPEHDIIFHSEDSGYAYNNWCYHFDQGLTNGGDNFLDPSFCGSLICCLTTFLSQSFVFWINTFIMHDEPLDIKLGDLHSILLKLKVGITLQPSFSCPSRSNKNTSSNYNIAHRICYRSSRILKSMWRCHFTVYQYKCLLIQCSLAFQLSWYVDLLHHTYVNANSHVFFSLQDVSGLVV
jgi:hypothetical protein